MTFQSYYQDVKKIKLRDPLAQTLGSSSDGLLEFSFADVVKVAGHGCPTVAGAYLMAYHGLKFLYQDEIPVRGNVEIKIQGSESAGVNGVIANVLSMIVGAAGAGGFKGLGGQFSRNNSLAFSQAISTNVQLKRKDNLRVVNLSYHPEIIGGNPLTSQLLGKILEGNATAAEQMMFQASWNERLKKIVCDEFDNPELVVAVGASSI